MSAFLLLLVKLNLAMGMAIVLAAPLRRPLRTQFGAPIAYAVWFLVPIAGIASLFPPRVAALTPAPIAPIHVREVPVSAIGHIAHSTLRVTEQLTGQSVLVLSVLPPAAHALPDTALLLFAAWALGALLMALYLIRLQVRFYAAVRLGKAGPAVLGFLRPRIVTPEGFQAHFTPQEQAAILAHERVHLARQDARINGLAALLRCLCWFNPLIHLGARWLRIDQELACDATAVAGAISRRTYAKALLKSQLVVTSLPLGCNWPGSQHPLIERISLLKRKPPGTARRVAGVSLVVLAATSVGLGAWAAQPPAAAKPMAAPRMVIAAIPAMVAAPSQNSTDTDPNQLVPNVNPASNGNDGDASKTSGAHGTVSAATVSAPTARTVSIDATTQSILTAPPQIASISPPSNIANQPVPTSQDASSEPREVLPKSTAAAPTTGEAATAGATQPVVMANTPDGGGDPNTIVCRAPQPIPGSGKFGPEACGHNYEWQKLALNGKDLAPDGKTLIARATVSNPKGNGDPNGVTCRTAGFLSPYPPLCRTNKIWANLIKYHLTIEEDGAIETQAERAPFQVLGGPNDYGATGFPN
jgi:beta-lactamase regulating signal transducer with metallopeptidase domain